MAAAGAAREPRAKPGGGARPAGTGGSSGTGGSGGSAGADAGKADAAMDAGGPMTINCGNKVCGEIDVGTGTPSPPCCPSEKRNACWCVGSWASASRPRPGRRIPRCMDVMIPGYRPCRVAARRRASAAPDFGSPLGCNDLSGITGGASVPCGPDAGPPPPVDSGSDATPPPPDSGTDSGGDTGSDSGSDADGGTDGRTDGPASDGARDGAPADATSDCGGQVRPSGPRLATAGQS